MRSTVGQGTTTPVSRPTAMSSSEPPPRKRPRLSESRAAISTREASAATSLEVDHMILDYLAYQALTRCLDLSSSEWPSRDDLDAISRDIALVDDQLNLFHTRHPTHVHDEQLRLRLLLLQLVDLITFRYHRHDTTPSLETLSRLRAQNQHRARRWIGSAERLPTRAYDTTIYDSALPVPAAQLRLNRAEAVRDVAAPPEETEAEAEGEGEEGQEESQFYGTPASVSLLDLLPLFMEVSAAVHSLLPADEGGDECGASVNPRWMQLAADLITHACLEQYLVRGAVGSDVLDEAFAWGAPRDADRTDDGIKNEDQEAEEENKKEELREDLQIGYGAREKARDALVAGMFRYADGGERQGEEDGDDDEADTWPAIRDAALRRFMPPFPSVPQAGDRLKDGVRSTRDFFHAHLARLAEEYPASRTEATLREYLGHLAATPPKPVLVQLERGNLDGMTKAQTREFLESCGIRPEDFLGAMPASRR